jgi:uncharacterized membrane protein YeaQ/YmgE (transglycosylase-associated protein family)
MTLIDVLLLLLVAGVCGAIGQAIAGFSRGGCLVTVVVGFIGALFGRWLAGAMNLPEPLVLEVGGAHFPVLWSIIGSCLFVALIGLMTRRSKSK